MRPVHEPIREPDSGNRAADRMVQWLADRGVRRVFGIPGGAVAPIYDALVDTDIESVVCQHEAMATYLAYGEAAATGRPAVVLVTAGPGVLNTLTAVAAAYMDEVPIIVITGDVRTDWAGRGAIQDGGADGLDVRSIFRSVTRFQDTLTDPAQIEIMLGQAWDASLQHPRGPALLQIPADLSCQATPVAPEWRASWVGAVPDGAEVEAAAAALQAAERPAIFVGVGARSAGVGDLALRLAYRLRAPIIVDVEGKGAVPDDDPLVLGLNGLGQAPEVLRYLQGGVDVMLTIGARFDDTSTRGFSEDLRPTKVLIQMDHDATRIGRAWPAELPIVGDLSRACNMLLAACDPAPVRVLSKRQAAIDHARDFVAAQPDVMGPAAPFNPNGVIRELAESWGSDARFVSDIGNHLLFAVRNLRTNVPGGFHVSLGLAGMGSGIGAAMGMAIAGDDERPVICICGDGGLLMVGTELATCARHRIPVVICVLDDARLGMVSDGMDANFGRCDVAVTAGANLVAFASAMGVEVVDVQSAADLRPRDLTGPLVLRVPIDPGVRIENPRQAGFSAANHA